MSAVNDADDLVARLTERGLQVELHAGSAGVWGYTRQGDGWSHPEPIGRDDLTHAEHFPTIAACLEAAIRTAVEEPT